MHFHKLLIARVAHEANRAFCESISDHSQVKWEDAPEWQRNSAMDGVEFHIAHWKLTGTPPPASASHDNWLKGKTDDGWKYGPVKDAEKKEHPCFVPYDQLPKEQRLKDYLFGSIVEAFIRCEAVEHKGAEANG